jgi:hypothetical protein
MAGKPPSPTPPRETSAAATGTNISTAIANAWLQNTNETTPDGTRTFTQSGTRQVTDPYTGKTYNIPTFGVTTTLSPEQQAIKAEQDRANLNLAGLGANLSDQLGGQLTENFKLGNEATEGRLFELGRNRLDPMFAQRDEDLRSRLANQGIKAGTTAYDRELANLGQQENDAYNELLLRGRGQASNELLTEDNQRINQISALLNGGQVSQPNFQTPVGVSGAPTTDNASIIGNSDQARMNAWGQGQAATGSLIGGLGGLFALSDPKAKTDKDKIGETEDGMGIYSYRYKGSPETKIGLMADEVKRRKPKAVRTGADGLMRVDYKKALA